jgi:PAS domain S-box-containing protein
MPKQRSIESNIARLSLISNLILLGLLIGSMMSADVSKWLLLLTCLLGCLLVIWTTQQIKQRLAFQDKSQANLLEALICGDYSLRARRSANDYGVSPLTHTINQLAERLSKQRWQSIESQLLVQTILEHIDIAILALDQQNAIVLFNPAAERLFGHQISRAQASLPSSLNIVTSLECGAREIIELKVNDQLTKFSVQVEQYKAHGQTHKLLLISNVDAILRTEQQDAWRRLIRVISHEINNSLSPISSISQTLCKVIGKQPSYPQQNQIIHSLQLIEKRAAGLGTFIEGYQKIAKLPDPVLSPCAFSSLLGKCTMLFPNINVHISSSCDITLNIDAIQFEQVLINIFKNALEATREEDQTQIRIQCQSINKHVRLTISDNGTGINNPDNIFVPFYSTKTQGSGIGLILCRQIIEAHRGRLSLENNTSGSGCVVTIELPL